MAKILVKNPCLYVAADTNNNELQFNSGITADMQNSGSQRVMIEVTVGTFRFGTGENPDPASRLYAVGEKLVLPIATGSMNLFCKASNVLDAFSSTVV